MSQDELKRWIQYTQRRYITSDVESQWKTHNPEGKDKILWEEYKKVVYGFMEGELNFIAVFFMRDRGAEYVKSCNL